MSEAGVGKTVCVTGASGFIASWIVKLLLQRGYVVKACVRDPSDPAKKDHLLALDGADERLHLVKANLLEEGSFDSAVEGCDGVFHVASPCYFCPKDPKAELLDPAVNGTINVLSSCAKTRTVKRVVLTSSMAAVAKNGKPRTGGVVVDETWFSDPKFCEESKQWYDLSKTLAEEAAWKFVKENNMDMVVLNPAVVIGPLLQPTINATSSLLLDLMNIGGQGQGFLNNPIGWVHVRDVANAHIQAFEIPSAKGRYCLAERVARGSDILRIVRNHYPALQLEDECVDDKILGDTYQISKVKAEGLGIEYIPLEVSIAETLESLKERKLVNF